MRLQVLEKGEQFVLAGNRTELQAIHSAVTKLNTSTKQNEMIGQHDDEPQSVTNNDNIENMTPMNKSNCSNNVKPEMTTVTGTPVDKLNTTPAPTSTTLSKSVRNTEIQRLLRERKALIRTGVYDVASPVVEAIDRKIYHLEHHKKQ